jgi:hypothetical protein
MDPLHRGHRPGRRQPMTTAIARSRPIRRVTGTVGGVR